MSASTDASRVRMEGRLETLEALATNLEEARALASDDAWAQVEALLFSNEADVAKAEEHATLLAAEDEYLAALLQHLSDCREDLQATAALALKRRRRPASGSLREDVRLLRNEPLLYSGAPIALSVWLNGVVILVLAALFASVEAWLFVAALAVALAMLLFRGLVGRTQYVLTAKTLFINQRMLPLAMVARVRLLNAFGNWEPWRLKVWKSEADDQPMVIPITTKPTALLKALRRAHVAVD